MASSSTGSEGSPHIPANAKPYTIPDERGVKGEADTLLQDLQRDFEHPRLFQGLGCMGSRKSKYAFAFVCLLVVVMIVMATVSLLVFKSVILPPSPIALCSEDFNLVIVPLGTSGGVTEDNLSAFLLSANGSPYLLALDAGDIFHGLQILTEAIQYQLDHNKYSEWILMVHLLLRLSQKALWEFLQLFLQ